MYCRECGEQIENPNAVICVKCGTKKGQGNNYCYNCGEELKSNTAEVCLNCGVKVKSSFNLASGQQKNKVAAGVLALFFGTLGIHRFYLGYTTIGIIQLVLTVCGFFTCGITTIVSAIWAIVDAITIFMDKVPDSTGNPLV